MPYNTEKKNCVNRQN